MYKFKAIKPGPYNDQSMSDVLGESLRKLGVHIKESFDRITSGWQGERPEWGMRYQAGGTWTQISVYLVDPESEGGLKWKWLDEGTKPHLIPKNPQEKGPLFFLSEYQAGSSPGSLTTYRGSSGGTLLGPIKQVHHPGIEPRGWTDLQQRGWETPASRWAQAAMNDAARASGHGKE